MQKPTIILAAITCMAHWEIVSALVDDYQQETRLGVLPNQQYALEAVEILKREYADSTLRIDDVAERVKVERTYLYRIFMRNLGVSPKSYLMQLRINQAIELLRNTNDAIGDIAIKVGFTSWFVYLWVIRDKAETFQSFKTRKENVMLKISFNRVVAGRSCNHEDEPNCACRHSRNRQGRDNNP